MPIYDYVCANCRHLTEVIHGIHQPGPRYCPSCGADGTMRKALSSPTVHFKGSGWAKKDRSSTSGARSRSAGGPAPSDAGSTEASAPADKDAAPAGPAPSSSEPTARSED